MVKTDKNKKILIFIGDNGKVYLVNCPECGLHNSFGGASCRECGYTAGIGRRSK